MPGTTISKHWIACANLSEGGHIVARPGDIVNLTLEQSGHYLRNSPGSIERTLQTECDTVQECYNRGLCFFRNTNCSATPQYKCNGKKGFDDCEHRIKPEPEELVERGSPSRQEQELIARAELLSSGFEVVHWDVLVGDTEGEVQLSAARAWSHLGDLTLAFCGQWCNGRQNRCQIERQHPRCLYPPLDWIQVQQRLHQELSYLLPYLGKITDCPACAIVNALSYFPAVAEEGNSDYDWHPVCIGVVSEADANPRLTLMEKPARCTVRSSDQTVVPILDATDITMQVPCYLSFGAGGRPSAIREDALLRLDLNELPACLPKETCGALRAGQGVVKALHALKEIGAPAVDQETQQALSRSDGSDQSADTGTSIVSEVEDNIFKRVGRDLDNWKTRIGGKEISYVICRSEGMKHIAKLLGQPGAQLMSFALTPPEIDNHVVKGRMELDTIGMEQSLPPLDNKAKYEYLRKIQQLKLKEEKLYLTAKSDMGDQEKVLKLRVEREWLEDQLGQSAENPGLAKYHECVRGQFRTALKAIERDNKPLYEHLKKNIDMSPQTGFRYKPTNINWHI